MAKQLTKEPERGGRRLAGAHAAVFGLISFSGAMFGWTAPLPAQAAEISTAQKAEIETIVRDYLIANPDVVRDAIDELDRRQQVAAADLRQKTIKQHADKLFDSAHQAVIGNPAGDVTLVEFFDYNCGYCKRASDDIAKLVQSDPKLRVVLKDLPVLGQGSVEAAQIATAARQQLSPEKFWEFHRKLLATRGSIGKAQALNVAKELGLDPAELEKDMKSGEVRAALKEVADLGDKLRLGGTPSWVVGNEVIVGAVGHSQLKTKIDNVRRCGKTVC